MTQLNKHPPAPNAIGVTTIQAINITPSTPFNRKLIEPERSNSVYELPTFVGGIFTGS